MNSFSELSNKRFFGTDDVREQAVVATIKGFGREEMEDNDGGTQKVSVMHLEGQDRAVILKTTTLNTLKDLFGTPNEAVGKPIELYFDPSVSFGGKRVGGLRLRSPGSSAGTGGKAPF
jgi:hypothetical protein